MINLTDHNQKRYNFIEWDGESPITTPGGEFYLPVCGLPSRDYRYGDGWVVMGHALRFYGDESGSHGKAKLEFVALNNSTLRLLSIPKCCHSGAVQGAKLEHQSGPN